MAIKDFFIKYDDNSKYLEQLDISKKNKWLSLILGYGISLILMISPIIFTAHFFIYSFYYNLVVGLIAIEFVVFLLLGEIFNHRLQMYFSSNEKKKLTVMHIVDGFIYLILCIICLLIVIFFIKNRK